MKFRKKSHHWKEAHEGPVHCLVAALIQPYSELYRELMWHILFSLFFFLNPSGTESPPFFLSNRKELILETQTIEAYICLAEQGSTTKKSKRDAPHWDEAAE